MSSKKRSKMLYKCPGSMFQLNFRAMQQGLGNHLSRKGCTKVKLMRIMAMLKIRTCCEGATEKKIVPCYFNKTVAL